MPYTKTQTYLVNARSSDADRIARTRLARNARRHPPKPGTGPKVYDPTKVKA
jgi:hypothetical protein